MRSCKIFLVTASIMLILLAIVSPLLGQDETIITLRAPQWIGDVFDNDLFDKFAANHPGVKVVLARGSDEDMYYPPAAYGLEDHLDKAEKYASSADVLFVLTHNLSVEATRAGYILDLSPLVNSDPDINVDDFFPAIWESGQWDRGIWALPVSASVQIVIYEVGAFDEAGLPYPDETWTIDDFANAARALTQKNEQGEVTVPGMEWGSPGLLLRSLTGQGFYDSAVVPNPPSFNNPELASLIETWAEVQKELRTMNGYDYDQIPLVIEQPWRLTNMMPDNDRTWAGALLPNGVAGLDVQGFAVSSGTQNPELAYELAKFLTTDAEVVQRFFGNTPARRSLVGVTPEDNMFFQPEVPDEVQALLDRALENALPVPELRYSEYLYDAVDKITEGADPQTALQEIEAEANSALDTAAKRREEAVIMVATPVPTPSIAQDQIVLKFGLNLFTSDTNTEQWDSLVADFTTDNPDVGNIDFTMQFYQPDDLAELDCYYQPYNNVPDADLSTILNLDPFMDADPNFDRNDFLGDTLEQMRRDDRTWAYPIVLQPAVVWYNYDLFTKAGVPKPQGDWTIDAFNDALQILQAASENGDPPFQPLIFGNTYILMLMAAYGAIPYDYRTTPPTLNLTDVATIEGMRQVLDLAKAGYIDYQELATLGGGGGFGGNEVPVYTDFLTSMSYRLQNRDIPDYQDPYLLTNYPRGSQFVPVSYNIGTAYINANTQNPDACYRWITTIAQRPDLFAGIPARLSLVNNPDVALAQGEDITALYTEFAAKISDPNAISFPSQFGGTSDSVGIFVEAIWLNRAFDNYVLRDGDLEADLADAESFINTYRECTADIPPYDPATLTSAEAGIEYFRQYTDCAISVDPTVKSLYAILYGQAGDSE